MGLAVCLVYDLVRDGALERCAAFLAARRSPPRGARTAVRPSPASWLGILSRGCWARTLASTGFVALFMVGRLMVQGGRPVWYEPSNPAASASAWTTRFLSFAYTDWIHLRLLLWPTLFCPDWRNSVDLVTSIFDPRAAIAVALVVALALGALWCVRGLVTGEARRSPWALALAWLVLPFLPAANIFFYVGLSIFQLNGGEEGRGGGEEGARRGQRRETERDIERERKH